MNEIPYNDSISAYEDQQETIDALTSALRDAAKLIPIARQHFPKSIRNSDKFKLELTCATINTALTRAEQS